MTGVVVSCIHLPNLKKKKVYINKCTKLVYLKTFSLLVISEGSLFDLSFYYFINKLMMPIDFFHNLIYPVLKYVNKE